MFGYNFFVNNCFSSLVKMGSLVQNSSILFPPVAKPMDSYIIDTKVEKKYFPLKANSHWKSSLTRI